VFPSLSGSTDVVNDVALVPPHRFPLLPDDAALLLLLLAKEVFDYSFLVMLAVLAEVVDRHFF
jgi:hypothetical protein